MITNEQTTSMKKLNKPTRKRFQILALIFISVVINYMDRTNLSVAAAALSDELSLSAIQMGLLFSAFGWTYSILQIPGGMAVDLVKTRLLYPFILTAWSLATLVQGFVSSFSALIGCRLAIGVFEAPSYPCNNKIVTAWFPENERASAIAVYTSGQFIGLAFLMPVLALIQNSFGWRGLFIISGGGGILWAFIWYVFYRDPQDHNSINIEELALIEGKQTEQPKEPKKKYTKDDFKSVFTNKKLWGIYIAQFCVGGILMFFLTWFPTYLVEYRGLDFIKSGFLASVPFLAAFCGVLISGFTSDYLVKKGVSKEFSRKAPIVIGMALSTCIVGANYTNDTFWVITFLSIAFFGNGLASITWVFVSLLAPKNLVGLVGGCFNAISGLSAVCIPVIIGLLVNDGDFKPALIFIAGLAVVGSCSYLFLVGKIEQIETVSTPN
ncbi:MFS transporter [Aliiglaciecola sp. 3_MG-2023]|uniref:MFS transporter n=1 Tax=Aliiglaciecola sp. 3_MG-2023 TaxID=3062644 RepID=UPI0026E4367D|nr:MFS transporter [Aliiglaciecola sp. 3_MG-2023]MDO6693888.1 MFS transporter [Aliiglaciecola sp. 3_MG-2023]